MTTMTEPMPPRTDLPRSEEWEAFRHDAPEIRKDLERTLRRILVHDPRATTARRQNVAPADVADEAFAWVLAEWRSKPSATSPAQWMRKRALQILDESLDRELLDAESRREERAEEARLRRFEVLDDVDDDERTRWIEMVGGAHRSHPEPFDALVADESVSSVEARLTETELLEQLDREMAALPEIRRRILVHRILDELPVDDIAYLLDVTAEDVERELDGAVRDLRNRLTAR